MPPRSPRPQLTPRAQHSPESPVHPFDQLYGTHTGGLIPREQLATGNAADKHVTAYYGVAPSILRTLIDRWHQQTHPPRPIEHYTFLDVGAGKGRAMIVAAENPFREVIGIELNPALASIARVNLAHAITQPAGADPQHPHREKPDLLAPMTLIEGDALTLSIATSPTLACLFHPFEAAALRAFLRKVEAAFTPQPGIFDLLYINAEHLSLLRRNPRFSVLWEGSVPMSTEDHLADLREIAAQLEYGSTGDEHCAILRYLGSPAAR